MVFYLQARYEAVPGIASSACDQSRLPGPAPINRILSAANGAEIMGPDAASVIDVIAGLSSRDLDTSMPSDPDPDLWQDVCGPVVNGFGMCIPTLDARGTLLPIRFKANA